MNFKNYIGEKVIAKDGREGTIVGVEESNVLIKFQEADPKPFGTIAFENGFLSFEKKEIQEEVEDEKQQAEQREVDRKAKQEAAIERNKNNHKIEVGQRVRRNGKSAKINYEDLYYEGMELIQGQVYGTNSKVIYENICKYLPRDKSLINNFGWHTSMYAQNATQEGYAVWLIGYSNITDASKEKKVNIISPDRKTITTYLDNENTSSYANELRVVFVKEKSGLFVFYGIYKCIESSIGSNIEQFELVTTKYPM